MLSIGKPPYLNGFRLSWNDGTRNMRAVHCTSLAVRSGRRLDPGRKMRQQSVGPTDKIIAVKAPARLG
jgi:hypothetical protein